eukprot:jgi/Botrbrau1/12695/Bobra.67_1s0059.1
MMGDAQLGVTPIRMPGHLNGRLGDGREDDSDVTISPPGTETPGFDQDSVALSDDDVPDGDRSLPRVVTPQERTGDGHTYPRSLASSEAGDEDGESSAWQRSWAGSASLRA